MCSTDHDGLVTAFADHCQQLLSFFWGKFDFMFCHSPSLSLPLIFTKSRYYALADNFTEIASSLLWLTATSFFKTLAGKRKSSVMKVLKSLKRGPARYVVPLRDREGITVREYELVVSTRQIPRRKITRADIDQQPSLWKYQSRTELGQRLLANQCEWCGTQEGEMQVHHVRKLADLKGKTVWECWMIERRRKTLVLCRHCHTELHAGRLSEKTRAKRELESRIHRKV